MVYSYVSLTRLARTHHRRSTNWLAEESWLYGRVNEGEGEFRPRVPTIKFSVRNCGRPGSKSNTGAGEIWSNKVKQADMIGGVFRKGFSKISRDPWIRFGWCVKNKLFQSKMNQISITFGKFYWFRLFNFCDLQHSSGRSRSSFCRSAYVFRCFGKFRICFENWNR